MRRLVLAVLLIAALPPGPRLAAASCTTPIALGPPGTAVWCGPALLDAPGTYHELADGWSDDFTYAGPPAVLGKTAGSDTGYLSWEQRGSLPTMTQQFREAGLWHADVGGAASGGTLMRPDRSFGFEAGHLVIDAETAVLSRGDVEWTEIVLTTADHPTTEQGLYARD